MSGNLCHQIEHHLYPDLPSNRLHEISVRVRQVCDKYDLTYTTGSFLLQYGKAWRTIAKLSLPDKFLRDTADDAPETRSERMFDELEPDFADHRSRVPDARAGCERRSPGCARCESGAAASAMAVSGTTWPPDR